MKDRLLNTLILPYFFLLMNSWVILSQNCDINFTYTNTGTNMIVLIHDDALNTNLLSQGDSLGAFMHVDDELICVGSISWDGSQQTLIVWGDDIFTSVKDGLFSEDSVYLMARSGDVVYDVFYEPNFTYQSNGIFTLSDSLTFIENSICTDDSFINNNDQPISIQLNNGWNMVAYTKASQMPITAVMSENFDEHIHIIKNINGLFWNELIDLLHNFNPGEGYMMYLNLNSPPQALQFSDTYEEGISFELSTGWNMVGYCGSEVKSIHEAMPDNFHESIHLIKNVNGLFWNEMIDLLYNFEPGMGYMVYVNDLSTPITLNFTD